MSLEAISGIAQAENDAKAAVLAAEAKAKQLLAAAEEAGKAAVEAANAKAASELAELRRQVDEKTMTEAKELSEEMENKKAVLRAKAEARLDKAAALIVERIVNS